MTDTRAPEEIADDLIARAFKKKGKAIDGSRANWLDICIKGEPTGRWRSLPTH